ncbi:MAG: hypothetical protein VX463_15885, partial [Pseudomonadota bacterium]|nr:hypothetical protein [Pseudomonadota bacterium]
AHALQSRALQALRVTLQGRFDPEAAGAGLTAVLCRVAGVEAEDDPAAGLARLEAALRTAQARAGDAVDRLLPSPEDAAEEEEGEGPGARAAPWDDRAP